MALAVVLFAPAGAGAATVSYDPGDDQPGSLPRVTFAGEENEVNRVTVSLTPSGTTITDRGPDLRAVTPGCERVSDRTLRCGAGSLIAYLGDRSDTLAIVCRKTSCDDYGTRVEGGNGHDVITGGAEPDRLFGGPGRDVLSSGGGPNGNVLYGGPGNDEVDGAGPLDRLFGEGGNDHVDTYGRGTVTCGAGSDGFSLARGARPVVASDCEAWQDAGPATIRYRRAPRSLTLVLPYRAQAPDCRWTFVVDGTTKRRRQPTSGTTRRARFAVSGSGALPRVSFRADCGGRRGIRFAFRSGPPVQPPRAGASMPRSRQILRTSR